MSMRVGAFEVIEPLPELNEPHALAVLLPWVDVGDVGSTALELIEGCLSTERLGKLVRPGDFYDFTRYRPAVSFVGGGRELEIPNTFINYTVCPGSNDLLIFHMLEPHMQGEAYADSALEVLQKMGVRRYCLIGGMYDAVPHTRPLIVSGNVVGAVEEQLRQLGVQRSDYEGPTSIVIQVSQEAQKYGIEVMSLIVHLPQYVRLEKDYAGVLRLTELLCKLYNLPIDLSELGRKAEKQSEETGRALEREAQLKHVVRQLEAYYDARFAEVDGEHQKLSPEVENFLRDATKRFGHN